MTTQPTLRRALLIALGALSTMTATITTVPPALASNHSDAPLIKQDPQANLTDVYAFIGKRYDDPRRWRPLAVANALDDPRSIEPGQSLLVPSLPFADPETGEAL
jgi:hypothetical protein